MGSAFRHENLIRSGFNEQSKRRRGAPPAPKIYQKNVKPLRWSSKGQRIFSLGFGRGWRAPTVPGIIIIQTILSFPANDPRRSVVLQLLVTWKISLEITQDFEQEEADTMVQLSQAYVEWEERTKQEGVDQGER